MKWVSTVIFFIVRFGVCVCVFGNVQLNIHFCIVCLCVKAMNPTEIVTICSMAEICSERAYHQQKGSFNLMVRIIQNVHKKGATREFVRAAV